MLRMGFAAAGVALAGVASASDSHLGLTRADLLLGLAEQVDGFGIPALRCGQPSTMRSCLAELQSGITLSISEMPADMEDFDRFFAGGEGRVFEVRMSARDAAASSARDEIERLCAAAASVARGSTVTPADVRVVAARAAEAAPQRVAADDEAATLFVDLIDRPSCGVSAQYVDLNAGR